MAEHFLYGAQVGAAFHEVGGKGMAEGVGGDVLGDAGQAGEIAEKEKDHDPC